MIGTDIVEVKRIKKALTNQNFLERILTDKEIEYVNSFKDKECHVAGFFACKEAVMKALANCKQISFLDIEIFHENSGKPYVKLYNIAKQVFTKLNKQNIEVSISQTKTYATSVCSIS